MMIEMVAKLDDLGRPAWIAIMVLGFILYWPVGLAILAFLIWSGRMGHGWHGACGSDPRARWERKMARLQEKMERWSGRGGHGAASHFPPTGNRAFDDYRTETLKKLEEEAAEFKSFLDRLRHAKDKAEFDQFMAERRNRPATEAPEPPRTPPHAGGPPPA